MLNKIYFGNSLEHWLIAAGIAIAIFTLLSMARKFVIKHLQKWCASSATKWSDIALVALKNTSLIFLFVVSCHLGTRGLVISGGLNVWLDRALFLGFVVQVAIWGAALITFSLEHYVAMAAEDGARIMTARAMGFLARLFFFSLLILWGLDNLGVNITTLVTGLGVGGVAVALALQKILSDLFASLSIVLDKPFVIGDFIVVDDFMGTIEYIGLKTTRLRSLSGEQLVFPNADLLQSRVRNFKQMRERRVVFGFGVTYDTSADTVENLPTLVREIVAGESRTRFDRAHFKQFGASSLDFEVVYYVLDADFNVYMDIQQRINLKLLRRLNESGVEFAFPTQTLYFQGGLPTNKE